MKASKTIPSYRHDLQVHELHEEINRNQIHLFASTRDFYNLGQTQNLY
jgi:hypothetical protein